MRVPRGSFAPRLLLAALLALPVVAARARADWLQPDPTFREAQLELRYAARDTVGQPLTAARLDTLALAHLRLGDLDEAGRLFARAMSLAPGDEAATAGLGKIALFRGEPARAESLLAPLVARVPETAQDLFDARVRLGRWKEAAALAEAVGQPGRASLLERLAAAEGAWEIQGPAEVQISWVRAWPVPLVKAKLEGQSVLLAIDTGAADLILDPSAARRCGVTTLPEQWPIYWNGTHVGARGAWVRRLELGSLRIERMPAAVTSLRRWSLEVNPQGETVAGVIGVRLLERFTPTLDYRKSLLVLRRPDLATGAPASAASDAEAVRVPFELWGEGEITLHGTLNGGRRMALLLETGMPGCGVAAPPEVFEEVGVRPGAVSRAVGGAGALLRGPRWAAVQVPTIAVGGVVKDNVRGWSGALDSAELWRHGVRRDALLAGDFLRGRRVTIDWRARELVFE